uniref:Arginyl-tRNA--protein transferase 1 n=1 Tax=Cacopsylla melanoneura TaxID=428564 RepID=A0A8D8YJN2_9HEMI
MNSERSIVEWISKSNGRSCGYCKLSSSSCSHGMWTHVLSVDDYQSLIDRGWRRSGYYCYKPVMNETCCPAYTIKCDAVNFKLTRSQKKLLKRFNHFFLTGEKSKCSSKIKFENRHDTSDMNIPNAPPSKSTGRDINMEVESLESNSQSQLPNLEGEARAGPSCQKSLNEGTRSTLMHFDPSEKNTTTPTTPTSSKTNSKSTKAKQLRIERRKKTLVSRGLTLDQVNATMQASKLRRMTKKKSLEDFINAVSPDKAKHRLEIKLVGVKSNEFVVTAQESGALFTKYQTTVHKEKPGEADFDTFKGFLVDSPLKAQKSPSVAGGQGYGSFHQQYWLDGRLIAVGVIDILPLCVSSVYFFYDPDYAWLSLGTISSLREIEFTRSLQNSSPSLSNYYMGFYIHSCPKMRYKGNLHPSYLLCPEVYSWHDLQTVRSMLDETKYARLNTDPEARDDNCDDNVDDVPVLTGGKVILYRQFKQMYDHDEEHPLVLEYASLVGTTCARRMLLVENFNCQLV